MAVALAPDDVVRTRAEGAANDREPLLVLEGLLPFLDAHGLGAGEPEIAPVGDGHSNVTFAVTRGDARFVVRRPPRGPLPPSAHDVLREARVLRALAGHARVPAVLAVCDDPAVVGAPFYVMELVDGHVLTSAVPPELDDPAEKRRIGEELVDTLVEIHAADGPSLAPFRRPGSYLERQVRRFTQLWDINKTREIPEVDEVARRLAAQLPEPLPDTVVHGDYRLGNMMVAREEPTRIVAVLDWEMGAIGDPRADVGYLLATYSEPNGRFSPLGSSPVTAEPGFPTRAQLVERYVARCGRDVEPLGWFEALALWKAAVFCEAIDGRFIRGELGAEDTRAAIFEHAVPLLAQTALEAVT